MPRGHIPPAPAPAPAFLSASSYLTNLDLIADAPPRQNSSEISRNGTRGHTIGYWQLQAARLPAGRHGPYYQEEACDQEGRREAHGCHQEDACDQEGEQCCDEGTSLWDAGAPADDPTRRLLHLIRSGRAGSFFILSVSETPLF